MKKIIVLFLSCLFVGSLIYDVLQRLHVSTIALVESTTEAESKPLNSTLLWWDKQIGMAINRNEWRLAADYTSRKAAYYKSIHDADQAEAFAELSVQYAENEPDKSMLLETDLLPTDSKYIKLESYVSVSAEPIAQPAKFEPQSGVYLGMLGADKRVGFNMNQIEPVYGRKHAMYLTYVGWRKIQPEPRSYFPLQLAETVKSLGGALQIGWEPRYGLDDVNDDEYVRTFAKEAKSTGIPIFLRYASEMNGAWVPWHGDPAKYVEKFRLIHDIMKEEAPNVVMVWSPNFVPIDNMDDYYPGDAYVDWIGYSLYATGGPSLKEDDKSGILQSFQPLAGKYPGKPIMISEGAISHFNLIKNNSYERWAEGQMGDMYAYLARLYPRIKAITYFNYSRDRANRTQMEDVYDLGENPFADRLYQRAIQSDLYLSRVQNGAQTKENTVYVPLAAAHRLLGKHKLFTYASIPQSKQPFAIGYYQDGKLTGMSYELPWEIEVDFAQLLSDVPLTIVAYNRQMESITEITVSLPK